MYFESKGNRYDSYYESMLIEDFTNIYQWKDKIVNSTDSAYSFGKFDLVEDIMKIMRVVLVDGTCYIEIHKLEKTSVYKIFIINYQFHFTSNKKRYFLVKNYAGKKFIYRTDKNHSKKIRINSMGIKPSETKRCLNKLVKLSNKKFKLYDDMNLNYQKKQEKFDYKLLKNTQKIHWNVRGLGYQIVGQNESYALYREINFTLLKFFLLQEILIQINLLLKYHGEDSFFNLKPIEATIKELEKCNEELLENKFSNEEIYEKILSL